MTWAQPDLRAFRSVWRGSLVGRATAGLCFLVASACARSASSSGDGQSHRQVSVSAAPSNSLPPGSAGSTRAAPVAAPATRPARRELAWRFPDAPFGPTEVVISTPAAGEPTRRFPVLVAFHGRGESQKGSRRGARGWLDDYLLARAISRLRDPPLSAADFEGFVSRERLGSINADLLARPYADLIVVCPYLPDVLGGSRAFEQAEPLARFVVDVLLPRVYAQTPAVGSPASTGIDGVSLGGRAALLVGLTRPAAFGSVGAVQAALDEKELGRWAELAVRAVATNPSLRVRLLTSDEDYFLTVNEQLASALAARAVPHRLLRVVGTHSYRFNRGPGSLEMLLFHDRALRDRPAP